MTRRIQAASQTGKSGPPRRPDEPLSDADRLHLALALNLGGGPAGHVGRLALWAEAPEVAASAEESVTEMVLPNGSTVRVRGRLADMHPQQVQDLLDGAGVPR